MLGGGLDLYDQAKSGEGINWGQVGISTLGGAAKGALAASGLGAVATGLAVGGTAIAEGISHSAAGGNLNGSSVTSAVIGGVIEGTTAGVLKRRREHHR